MVSMRGGAMGRPDRLCRLQSLPKPWLDVLVRTQPGRVAQGPAIRRADESSIAGGQDRLKLGLEAFEKTSFVFVALRCVTCGQEHCDHTRQKETSADDQG
jgi:hypothetical protein